MVTNPLQVELESSLVLQGFRRFPTIRPLGFLSEHERGTSEGESKDLGDVPSAMLI